MTGIKEATNVFGLVADIQASPIHLIIFYLLIAIGKRKCERKRSGTLRKSSGGTGSLYGH